MRDTRVLAEFATATKLSDVPPEVRHRIKRLILDQLGCEIGCAELPWSLVVRRAIARLASRGDALVVVHGDRLPPDEAAFVNSTFGHGDEIDDAHVAARTHPGAVVVPAVMSVAAANGEKDGRKLLLATTLGYEVMIRVALASMPGLMEHHHHHTPPAVGPFGAGVAAAILLGLNTDAIHQTLSIAGSHSAGLVEYTQSGGSVKRIHCAIPAQAGIRSAYLAQEGLTGPTEVLEGRRGFLEAFAQEYDASRLTEGLGRTYHGADVAMKTYTANFRVHAPLEALLGILRDHALAFSDIEAIRVGASSATLRAVGAIVEPRDAVGAQFSLRYALPLAAKHGASVLAHITAEHLADEDVGSLARGVELYVDEQQEREIWRNHGALVTVRTRGGQELSKRVSAARGTPENPLSDAEVEEKFRGLAEPVLGEAKADRVVSAVWAMEEMDPGRELWPHLVRGQ